MYAFAPNAPLTAPKATVGKSAFTSALPANNASRKTPAPTMILRTPLRPPVRTGSGTTFGAGGFGNSGRTLTAADTYMASCIRKQYLAMSNASGVFSVQCTEGSVKFAAEVSRVRSLNAEFRARQASPFKKCFDMYENRKQAIATSHNCHYEESLFSSYAKSASTYNTAKSEANGTCSRYASPENDTESAMLRYMDIQMKRGGCPTGVYAPTCNEASTHGQAEDVRIAALNTAFRQGQKSLNKLFDEKYQQKKHGYHFTHGCDYEDGIVSNYPSVGAAFRSKSYGY